MIANIFIYMYQAFACLKCFTYPDCWACANLKCIVTKEDEKRIKQLDRVIKHVAANIY